MIAADAKIISRVCATLVAVFLMAACHSSPELPPRKTIDNGLRLSAVWVEASIVATGRLTGVKRIGGAQKASQHDGIATVYPCQGEFVPAVSIKGQPQRGKLLWFSYFPNCTFEQQPGRTSHAVERLWFLRTDGPWLRPVADNTWTYLELFQPLLYVGASQADLRAALGKILLTPSAVSENTDGFLRSLPNLFDLACEVAGDRACYEALGALQERSPSELQGPVCAFLAGFFDECGYTDCAQVVSPFWAGPETHRSQPKRAALSEEIVRRTVESGDNARVKLMLQQLHMLSCNRDSSVRETALAQLRQYFPDDASVPCVRCR